MDYVPRAAWGSILITSRRREFLSYGTAIEISEMSPEEGLKFLTSIARFGRDLNPDEQQLALKLLQSLGYFPLAIEQAGAYISQRISDDPESYSHALANYLDSYERNAKMLLRYRRFSGVWINRNDSALTTWEVSFNAIKQESSEASDLLQLCGFLANSDIFEEMFRLGLQLPANDTTFQESVSKLSSYSLVTFRSAHDAFSIHPLVQLWVRERVTLDVQQRLANDAFQLVARSLRLKNEERSRDYTAFERRIIPHLDNAVDNMRKFLSSFTTEVSIRPPSNPIRQSPLSIFYDTMEGWYLWVWGAMSDVSISCHRFFISDIESSSEKWQMTYKLGTIYRHQFLHQSSERAYGWAFAEACKRLHQEHPKTPEIAGDLAWSIYLQGRYDEASDWYSWLLESRNKVLGKDHPSTLGAIKGLASISTHRGDYDEALRLLFEALARRQKRLGLNDVLTINVMHDLALVFERQENHSEALRWYEQVLSLTERQETPGDKHEDTLQMIHNIGIVYHNQNQHEEALRWYQRALTGRQETLGDKHEDTLHTISNIGLVYQEQRNYEEAFKYLTRALAGRQETLGDKHEDTLQTVHLIGMFFNYEDNLEEALRWYQRALVGRQEKFGEKHQQTLHTSYNIGLVLKSQGQYEEALEVFERVLAVEQETLGEMHEDTLDTIYTIGLTFQYQGNNEEALGWYKRALAGRQTTLGEMHEKTQRILHKISDIHLSRDGGGLDLH